MWKVARIEKGMSPLAPSLPRSTQKWTRGKSTHSDSERLYSGGRTMMQEARSTPRLSSYRAWIAPGREEAASVPERPRPQSLTGDRKSLTHPPCQRCRLSGPLLGLAVPVIAVGHLYLLQLLLQFRLSHQDLLWLLVL